MDPQNTSITSLPIELLNRVCEVLEPEDWGTFRMTGRQIYENTLDAYKTHHFQKISLLLTREGLERLEEIAASRTLRGSVQEIRIIPNLFHGWRPMDSTIFSLMRILRMQHFDGHGHVYPWFPSTSEERDNMQKADAEHGYAAYKLAVEEQGAILHSSALVDTLERCLPRLENLVHVGLRACLIPHLLYREGDPSFRCLGLRALRTWFSPAEKYDHCMSSKEPFRIEMLSPPHSLAFSQLLKAIIRSKRKIQSLHTCSVHCCGIKLGDLQLSESQSRLLLPLLDDLTTLHMCIHIQIKEQEGDEFDEDTLKRLHGILVKVAPKLEVLTFAQWSSMEEVSPIHFQGLSQKTCFSRLKELHIHSIEVTVNSLEDFIRTAAPTLKRLSLRLVSLVDALKSAPALGPMPDDYTPPQSMGEGGTHRLDWFHMSAEAQAEAKGLWKRVFESWADHLELQLLQLSVLGYRGREFVLLDDLYKERGQPNANPSSSFNLKDFSFDAERASVPFKQWIKQLRIEMQSSKILGMMRLPGTTAATFIPRTVPV